MKLWTLLQYLLPTRWLRSRAALQRRADMGDQIAMARLRVEDWQDY